MLARGTPGFVGADLQNLVNEAALLAARRDAQRVAMVDFEMAKDKVLLGAERRSLIMSDEDKRVTAYHEGGHALVALLTEGSDPVHKVTIIPRGMALGVTQTLPVEDRYNLTQHQMLAMIKHAMGGRAAEELVFGHLSTGAANDLLQATRMAREMICRFGMSEAIGPVSFDDDSGDVFLGRDFVTRKNYSEKTAEQIDAEVKRLLSRAVRRGQGRCSPSNRAVARPDRGGAAGARDARDGGSEATARRSGAPAVAASVAPCMRGDERGAAGASRPARRRRGPAASCPIRSRFRASSSGGGSDGPQTPDLPAGPRDDRRRTEPDAGFLLGRRPAARRRRSPDLAARPRGGARAGPGRGRTCSTSAASRRGPGASAVSAALEIARTLPVIEALAKELHTPISIDTRKAAVAEAALAAGARVVNDVSGLGHEPALAARGCCARRRARARTSARRAGHACSARSPSRTWSARWPPSCRRPRRERARWASRGELVVDPGLGFGKPCATTWRCSRTWRSSGRGVGLPVLVGPSRKAFLGELTGDPVDERDLATAVVCGIAVFAGADARARARRGAGAPRGRTRLGAARGAEGWRVIEYSLRSGRRAGGGALELPRDQLRSCARHARRAARRGRHLLAAAADQGHPRDPDPGGPRRADRRCAWRRTSSSC